MPPTNNLGVKPPKDKNMAQKPPKKEKKKEEKKEEAKK
jgi:hypothetical protein